MEATRLCPYCLQPLPGAAQSCPHCGKSFAGRNPGGTLPVGTVLAGRYTVGEMLSIDGEGILYRGAENLGRFRVTIKEYLPITLTAERTAESTLRPKTGSEVLFKTTRMDFADLYRSIQRITPANGLEAVLDVVEANNSVYAILENLGGTPLDQWLENHPGTIRPDDACTMLQPVFEGVAAMHKIGLVHRGICPENIRVMENDRCRLAGYATVGLRTAGSGLHEQLYEGYSAPEQYSTAEFEGRYTDEYSLAAVFYRMVCGQAPVPAAQRIVADSNPRAKSVNGSLPLYVSQVLQLGLRLRPMERIQTVPQLYQALSSKEYTAELTRTMKPETPVRTAPPEPERKEHLLSLKALLAGIVILLSILILLTLWSVLSQHIHQPAASAAESEPASSEVMVPQNLVPNFIGMDYTQVQNNREYTSMYLFYVTEEYSDTAPAGQIIQQEPSADTVLKAGETIRLVVSKGPQMAEMPNIIGFTQDSAVKELEARGLVASCFMVVNDGSYASGCVVRTSEEPGTKVEVGTVITVYIAADPSVQSTVTPEEPAATEPTTTEPAPPETTDPTPTEYNTD
ncbi:MULTISPECIES: PASTA domain-containing protein [unclassified Faecalibacterium]|uniref:PASTA domain-containing protein n=1 Tax=unclassified Faecalibacterium TaxID=2646395 RepID=UPI0012AF8D98|nr:MULTISPECIES: PASTA domain-containing protein [unclassified Faecalibacterium]MSD35709.1 PASTA domain-containing protein [Faecalibacterium sp. BIOML-A2]MSD60722.1 PASTA domain-containing protein [Faecalibacterium sp. BIOML-A1]